MFSSVVNIFLPNNTLHNNKLTMDRSNQLARTYLYLNSENNFHMTLRHSSRHGFVFPRQVCHMNSTWFSKNECLVGAKLPPSRCVRDRKDQTVEADITYRNTELQSTPKTTCALCPPRMTHFHMMATQRCQSQWFHFCGVICVSWMERQGRLTKKFLKKYHICILWNKKNRFSSFLFYFQWCYITKCWHAYSK